MGFVTEEEQSHFEEKGYVKLESVVPEELCEAVVDTIWACLGQDPDDPETWYQPPEGMDDHWGSRAGGMVQLTQHQSLWDTRQHPRLYQAFAEILAEERLWTSMDRCNMTPPRHPDHPDMDASFIHWDVDVSDLPGREIQPYGTEKVPYGVQGVLYLDDISEDQGTFQCVPDIYENVDEWVDRRSDPEDSLDEDALEAEGKIERIPGQQGDLVVWNRLLPHGNGSNTADEPRLAQYVRMQPEQFHDTEARDGRVEGWQTMSSGDPREWERKHAEPADLTPLGRKLLGVDPWRGWLTDS